LLSRYGAELAEANKQRAIERAKLKRLARLPVAFSIQATALLARIKMMELPHHLRLTSLARQAAAMVWDIPVDRLRATLTSQALVGHGFGKLSTPSSFRGRILRLAAVSYGGVVNDDGALTVVARATIFPLLAKELLKGTAELICLHGLRNLSDDSYQRVLREADQLEYEPWMLQTGGELWRRLLLVVPADRPIAEVLMHLARLPPNSLESLVRAVIDQPEWARELIAGIGQTGDGQNDDQDGQQGVS